MTNPITSFIAKQIDPLFQDKLTEIRYIVAEIEKSILFEMHKADATDPVDPEEPVDPLEPGAYPASSYTLSDYIYYTYQDEVESIQTMTVLMTEQIITDTKFVSGFDSI